MKVYLINRADIQVFCDGKRLRINREGGKEYVETDKTDGQPVTLRFLRKHELSRPFWWLYALLFWVLGVMGFFHAALLQISAQSRLPRSLYGKQAGAPAIPLCALPGRDGTAHRPLRHRTDGKRADGKSPLHPKQCGKAPQKDLSFLFVAGKDLAPYGDRRRNDKNNRREVEYESKFFGSSI